MSRKSIISDAASLAQTEEGVAIIEENYAGSEHFGRIYKTQEAAALAALLNALECSEPDALSDYSEFSVHAVVRADGSMYYAAKVGHDDRMTHEDDYSFAEFICNKYHFDSETHFIEEVSSGEFELASFDLNFDSGSPYTLSQVYHIARNSEQALSPAMCCWRGASPVVVELENDQYLVASLDSEVANQYGILSQDDFDELKEKLLDMSPYNIEYSGIIHEAIDTASVYSSGSD